MQSAAWGRNNDSLYESPVPSKWLPLVPMTYVQPAPVIPHSDMEYLIGNCVPSRQQGWFERVLRFLAFAVELELKNKPEGFDYRIEIIWKQWEGHIFNVKFTKDDPLTR